MKIINRVCESCGRKIGIAESAPVTKDSKQICTECTEKVFPKVDSKTLVWIRKHTFKEFEQALASTTSNDLHKLQGQEKEKGLAQISKLKTVNFDNLYFDSENKEVLVKSKNDLFKFNYDDIAAYEPIERGHSEKKHHGIARAVTGGVLLGPVGAVVGATTGGKKFDYIDEMGVDISLNRGTSVSVRFIRSATKQSADVQILYKKRSDLSALLDSIIVKNNVQASATKHHTNNSQENADITDQLRKLKSLVDDGILTQEEFDTKKKQILNI